MHLLERSGLAPCISLRGLSFGNAFPGSRTLGVASADGRAQWKKIWIEKAGLTPAGGAGKGAALRTVAIAAWSSCVLPLDRARCKPVIPPAGPMAKATTALPLPRGAGQ